MTDARILHATITFSVNIAILAVVWLHYVRSYRVDAVRQELFEIRDRMFEIASRDPGLFTTNAYLMMEDSINRTIQYAGRFGSINYLIALVMHAHYHPLAQKRASDWNIALDQLQTTSQRNEFQAIREAVARSVAIHLLFSSPLAALLTIPAFLASRLKSQKPKSIASSIHNLPELEMQNLTAEQLEEMYSGDRGSLALQ